MAFVESAAVANPDLRIAHHPRLRWLLVALWTGVFVIHSLIYLALIPPWQAPDEPTSVELLLTMSARGRLVSIEDMDLGIQQTIVESMERERYWDLGAYGRRPKPQAKIFASIYWGSTQLHRPPLYQSLFLPLARAVSEWPVEQQLLLFRAATIMMGAVTVAVIALIGYELAQLHAALPLVLPALAALHPQFAYSSATFNSDNLVAMLGALVFFTLLRMLQQGVTGRRVLLLIGLVALGFFTKRTFLFVVPVLLIGLIWHGLQRWHSRGRAVSTPAIYGGVGLLLASGLLLLSGVGSVLYGLVDRFVFNASRTNDRALLWYSVSMAGSLLEPWITRSLPFLSRSFWGSYGWHQVVIGPYATYALLSLVVVTWASTLIRLVVRRQSIPGWARRYLWLCWWAIMISLAIIMLSAPPTLNMLPQGRYLFPVFGPILLLIAFGLCWWWPRRWMAYGVNLTWLALITLDVYCIVGVVIPGFYR